MSESETTSYELTAAQRQIWLGQKLGPSSPLYNMAFAFVFPVGLDREVFCRAWSEVAADHQVLRTRIVERSGEARATIGESVETTVLDLSSETNVEQRFRRFCRRRCAAALPLAERLVDSVLVEFGDGRTGWYLNQHHVITDAWSTRLLFREVGRRYQELVTDFVSTDLPSPQSVRPYARVAQELESRPVASALIEHWSSRDREWNSHVAVYGRDRSPERTESQRWTLKLGKERSAALAAVGRSSGFGSLSADVSMFSVFACLFSVWLHKVSGQFRLKFDAPVAGRPTLEAKRSIGLFVELFPMALEVAPDDSFRTLGTRCLAEAMQMLRCAQPGSRQTTSRTASNVVLNFVPFSLGEFAGLTPSVEWLHPGHADVLHTLRLQIQSFGREEGTVVHFDWNEGCLPRHLRERSLAHFENVVDALIDDPDQPIAAVPVTVAADRLDFSSDDHADQPALPERTVWDVFEHNVEIDGHRIAVHDGELELSFAELHRRVSRLAAHLVDRGVEPGDRVAVVCRRGWFAVVGVLAALRARAAFVPLERSLPTRRLRRLLRDCEARFLLVDERWSSDRSVGECEIISPEMFGPAGFERSTAAAVESSLEKPRLADLAYVIFTSGSSGRPKGVPIQHRGLMSYLQWARRTYVRDQRLNFALVTSMSFDLTVTSFFLPLISGGTLVVYRESSGRAESAVLDVLRDNVVDFVKLTPAHLSLVQQAGLDGSKIRRLVIGGELLTTRLAKAVDAQLGGRAEIYNEYGPTEAVVGCVAHRYDPSRDTSLGVPIGVPADHVRLEILDRAGLPVPEGTPGELWISRHGLSPGYLGQSQLTAERFRPLPFDSGRTWYRSGDLVRQVAPGKLEYLGRLDRQVKISGFRVEPEEIEAALREVPGIAECAVIPSSSSADRRVAAHAEVLHCRRCGLPSDYPLATLNEHQVCSVCVSYDEIKENAGSYFSDLEALRRVFESSPRPANSEYDCMMLFSGGKDSTYALCQLVEMGLSVYAFTLDNGFISPAAISNIRTITKQLGVAVEFASTPAMNAIFRDSLERFSNVCNGCFKTIYTLSLQRARELEIPVIVTGLSRGQMFETRLTEDVFRHGRWSPREVDAAVLAARKAYHQFPDEASSALNRAAFGGTSSEQVDELLERIRFVDFYRYCDVDMDELYDYLRTKVPWVRPEDTGRSTNCLINDAGIYVHRKERGFHNYALPYSWDVRLGHKRRDAALEELDDQIDVASVESILAEVGYRPRTHDRQARAPQLLAFYVASEQHVEAGEGLATGKLRDHLAARLPPQLIPSQIRRVEQIPLTVRGKPDEEALRRIADDHGQPTEVRPPEGPVEEYLVQLWQEELGVPRVGRDDDFFERGGTSLVAMQVMLRLCREFDVEVPLESIFSSPKLADLARVTEDRILEEVEQLSPG